MAMFCTDNLLLELLFANGRSTVNTIPHAVPIFV